MTKQVMKILVVACLIWGLTPGLLPVVENLWHLTWTGHTAHAPDQGPDHAPVGKEHGCTGTFHLCSCHPTQVSELVPTVAAPGLRRLAERLSSELQPALPDPAPRGLDRPPRC